MFNWFKKEIKEEKKEPEVERKSNEELIQELLENNEEFIEKIKGVQEKCSKISVGDLVKLNVDNSPEMVVTFVYGGAYDVHFDYFEIPVLVTSDEKISVKYFDNNGILRTADFRIHEISKVSKRKKN